MVGREKKNVQSQRDTKDYTWQVANNCAWLECEVRVSDALLFKKDGNRRWGERQGQTKDGGTSEH